MPEAQNHHADASDTSMTTTTKGRRRGRQVRERMDATNNAGADSDVTLLSILVDAGLFYFVAMLIGIVMLFVLFGCKSEHTMTMRTETIETTEQPMQTEKK